ncbi:hypothetical protein SAMN05878249_1816 [Vreelandella aquamarina]|nr:hypothetical protein SAMN05878249_1816 [Halomonas meridiana]SIO38120.1 hypothetical protein SAMN05878442_2794 [Halomonas meridiana]
MGTHQENQQFRPFNMTRNHLKQTGQAEPLITD